MPPLEQIRDVIRAFQTSVMVLLAKIVSNSNLRTSTILAERLILNAWLVPGCDSGDITVLKIQTKICKDGR